MQHTHRSKRGISKCLGPARPITRPHIGRSARSAAECGGCRVSHICVTFAGRCGANECGALHFTCVTLSTCAAATGRRKGRTLKSPNDSCSPHSWRGQNSHPATALFGPATSSRCPRNTRGAATGKRCTIWMASAGGGKACGGTIHTQGHDSEPLSKRGEPLLLLGQRHVRIKSMTSCTVSDSEKSNCSTAWEKSFAIDELGLTPLGSCILGRRRKHRIACPDGAASENYIRRFSTGTYGGLPCAFGK